MGDHPARDCLCAVKKSRLYNLGQQGKQAAAQAARLPPAMGRGIVAPALALVSKFQVAD
jgi:hypothetical protein